MTEASGTSYEYLSLFLGPKAEHADLFEDLILLVLRDYVHWRKNYFPGDPILLTKALQRDFVTSHDALNQQVHELLAQLRRNFPFYSPRYIAHELSDTLMPAMLGYFAAMLFNPNNVTPEAAPVTTEMEIDACAAIMRMLGYEPPPAPPDKEVDAKEFYSKLANKQFGWAHLTSGGTVANIEALWVARQVKYFPLAVRELCVAEDIPLEIKLPNGTRVDLRASTAEQVLSIKPNESIYLLPKIVTALAGPVLRTGKNAIGEEVWSKLNRMPSGLGRGFGKLFNDHPPVILVGGTRHYSVAKAADVLGIGQENVLPIDVDTSFRMDAKHLQHTLNDVLRSGRVPIAVVATAGTTEEGAVDPIDKIVALRDEFCSKRNASFWLHIDAAWGGFVRSLFSLSPREYATEVGTKLSRALGLAVPTGTDLGAWHGTLELWTERSMRSVISRIAPDAAPEGPLLDDSDAAATARKHLPSDLKNYSEMLHRRLLTLRRDIVGQRFDDYAEGITRIPNYFGRHGLDVPSPESLTLSSEDRRNIVASYVSHSLKITKGIFTKTFPVNWPTPETANAFLSFPRAESITVDPHKMGYAPYPSGSVAFRNDRVRLFILQRAPYITAATPDPLFHLPPRHSVGGGSVTERKVITESFSPYMLEGSRPGATAAGAWLATRAVPLTMREHGAIVRASILAARDLYEWLRQWNEIGRQAEHGVDYMFVPLTPGPPDTNLVTFVVKKRTSPSLVDMNALTRAVYDRFTILSELGEREYSYSQPFFLSNTVMRWPEYAADLFARTGKGSTSPPLFERCDLSSQAKAEYRKHGVAVLRATVMNPYIHAMPELNGQNIVEMFVEELARAAEEAVRVLR